MRRRRPTAPSSPRASWGHTLLEIATALLVLTTALGVGLPRLQELTDRSAVVGAREAVVGLLARARTEAVTGTGARMHLVAHPPGGWVEVAGDTVARLSLEGWGVSLVLPAEAEEWNVALDGLGLGIVASGTVRIRRRGAEAVLRVSGYGRVRR